ncbi:GntR family transcriptional regulator [Martelella alba]|uniref:GntR family transcriptional regulator n=1 Tax=Martelella alba TaxID=2590451 RepID=A0ABY2SMU2_9HYPH|nr:GntR family transcriptional regulator [Martelella alba]TKI07207.1 GntR family transcriptional regulator [Martelella alba]
MEPKKENKAIADDLGSLQALQFDPSSPLYIQIKEYLRAKILEGVYSPNQKMPSESEMMEVFSVSRITIRQALNDLQSEGLVFKVHGKGTFVAGPRATQDLGQLQGFGIAMRQMGYETHSRLLSFNTVRAPALVVEKLNLTTGVDVTELKRLRFLNREPISVDVTYIIHEIGERLRDADFTTKDIFHILEEELYIPLGHADLQISSGLANEEYATHLNIEEGAPILMIDRTVHTVVGKPIEFEHLYYRGDTFQFNFRVNKVGGQ